MTNAEKFLEELKKKQKNGIKIQMLEDKIAQENGIPRDKLVGGDASTSAFLAALDSQKVRKPITYDDIAPVKPTVGSVSGTKHGGRGGSFTVKSEEDDSLLDFFDAGAFRDGYQIGDISKTILGTAGDIGVGAVKGVMKMGEGIGDAAQYGAAAVADAFGADEWADDVRKSAQRTVIDDAFAPVADYLDKYSVLGRTMNSATEAVGQIGAILATGGLAGAAGLGSVGASAATMGVMGLSSFGSSTGEAYKGGAETGEAELYGAIAGTADAITELLSGGLGKGVKAVGLSHGLGGLDDIVAKKVSEKITNTIAKNAVQFGVKASGEGLEEVLAGTAQAVGKKLTYMEKEELSQILADENLLEQFVVGAMASGVAQVPSVAQANKAGADYVTGRTKNEQAVVDRVVEQRIKDAETDQGGVKLTPKQRQDIEEQAASDMERGRIEIDTIEEVLGGEEYKAYQDAVKEEDALRKEYEELGALKEPTLAEQTRYKELHEKASEFSSDERRTALKKKLSEHVAVVAQGDRLSESYAERARRSEYFTEDVEKFKSDAAKKTVQNLVDAKLANNTGRTHDMVETVAKIAEDKGIVFNFTNNQKLRESGKMDAVAEGVTINGYKDADGITINLDSPKAWDFIVGHEVTHALEGTAEYTALSDAVKVYAQTKGEYDSRKTAITSLYAEGTDVDSELTADMVGELFHDEQFVSDLSVKHQNVFQKVFAEIKHLVKMVTAGSKEARQLEQVKRTFEKAYRAAQTAKAKTQYSFVGENANIDKSQLAVAKQMESDGKTSEEIYAETGWYKQSDGKWRTEIQDEIMITENFSRTGLQSAKDAEADRYLSRIKADLEDGLISEEVYTELEEFAEGVRGKDIKNGKLPSFLNAPQLYEAYPQLKKVNLTFRKISAGQGYSDIGQNQIVLDPEGLNDAGLTVREGLAHEIQHFIQNIEGFASGSSPEAAGSYEAYRKAGGEIEARDVEDRLRMSAEDRRKYMPTQFSLSQDSEGRQLSEGQREYFRESKVTDENGNLKVMYHGTQGGGFHVFDPAVSDDGISLFFTDRNEVAMSYSGTSETYAARTFRTADDFNVFFEEIGAREYSAAQENGRFVLYEDGDEIAASDTADGLYEEFRDWSGLGSGDVNYEVYLNLTHPFEMDADGHMWNELPKSQFRRAAHIKADDYEVKRVGDEFRLYRKSDGKEMPDGKMQVNENNVNLEPNYVRDIIVGKVNMILDIRTDTQLTTRYVAKWAKEAGYDGVIFKNIEDSGMYSSGDGPGTVAVAFSSEQVKSAANDMPTGDKDIRRSLSDTTAPVGGRGVAARDLLYQGEEMQEAAPVRQTAEAVPQMQQSAPVMVDDEPAADDIAPIPGEHSEIDRLNAEYDAVRAEFDALSADVQSRYTEMSPAEQEQAMADVLAAGERLQAAHDALNREQQSVLASYTDADVPPEVDAPYYGEEDALPMPDDPMADRDEKEVGNRSVKAYQYLNPEVKPYFREEANAMLGDLRQATRGERFVTWDTAGNEAKWTGVERTLAYDLAGLKDRFGYSYEQLEKGIQAIIDDDGAENNAVSKRIELLIHDRLAKGYVDAYSGIEIPANEEYLDFLREKQITEYNDAAFDALMADAESLIPPAEDVDDVAPVAVETEVEEIDAPVADTAEMDAAVGEIQSTYDKILAKKQNAEATLEAHKKERAERAELYKNRIDELQRKLDHKKRKDTKAAVKLAQQITRVKELAANVDADYAKRISDAEKRIAKRDFELNQDHTEADKLERAYAKIDAQLAEDRAAVEAEFAQRREELSASIADKNTFVGERAKELYSELSHLKKGVRASYELGYLLDHGYDWRTLKSTLLKVNLKPDGVINPDSVEESVIREMLNEEYASRTFELGELDGEMQDRLAELEADAEAQKAEVRKSEEKLHRKQVEERYMNDMKVRFAQSGIDLDVILRTAKDVSGWTTVDKTPQRVNYAVFGDEAGEIMNDLTVNRVAQNETEGIRWLNRYTDPKTGEIARISKHYNIKPGSKESAAAMMYGEGFYVNEFNELVEYGDRELAADFPDAKLQANIKGLAHDGRIRAIYDETLDAINEVRVRNGYPEIPKRENYYMHYMEMGDFFSQNGLPFNPNDMRNKDLPTDINGMTVDLKPGKPYFASEKQRKGIRTTYDLFGGLEKYLTSAKDQIYHIDDIQRHRALRNYIADGYGQAKGLDSLAGLDEAEVQERIQLVFGNHLSTYAKFLNEEANILAGKTALIDRALEGVLQRRGMTFMSELNKQVGANQVGFNVSSSLTNLLSGVQAFSKMNKGAFIKGFAQTVSNRVGGIFGRGDNFAKESSVMVRREGAKRFKTNWWQRRQDNAYALMGAVDSVMTEVIARAKYTELTGKGMSTEQAHYETDKWVSALMGDRSLGQMPHLFNSKTFGMILKYQLEVRNQLDSMFADTIREAKLSTAQIEDVKKRNAVKAAKIASTFATLAVTQHIFGQVFESVAGYNPAFDIIEAIIKAAGWDDDEDDDDTVLDNLEQGLLSIAEDMPYYSILSGGRIPIESALPIETIIKGKDSYGNEVNRWKTAAEALPYYLLPGGYGQIKKTAAGLGMYLGDHPVAGSYTASGNLRFPVGTEPLDVAQAAVFGQYSSANARDYFDNERKPLSPKQVDEYAAADMTIQDYWRYRDGLKEHDKLADQAEYINSLDIPTWKKNLFINNLTDRKEDIDMADFDKYGSLEEMDFAKNNPEKYELLKSEGVDYNLYKYMDNDRKNAYSWAAENPEKYSFIRDIGYTVNDYAFATKEEKAAFTWAYDNPDKYLVSRAVSDDLFAYRGYTDALNDIKADKDSEGKSISGSRKDKVIDYINGLDLDYGAKIILLKQEYPAEDAYNYDIIDYLNERDDISGDDMVVMLTALGFKVLDDGTVTWD